MSLAEQIYEQVRRMPEPTAAEVLDFIGFLEMKAARRQVDERIRPFDEENWPPPIHLGRWDESLARGRETLYGDDGR